MKLTEEYFFPTVTDKGAAELYAFTDSILYKCGSALPIAQHEDIRQEMVLKCLEKLSSYDASKGVPLGGFLYWQCRGVLSTWANKHRREIPIASDVIISLKGNVTRYFRNFQTWTNVHRG